MIIVTFDPTAIRYAVPDALAEAEAAKIIADGVDTVVANGIVIDHLRLLVAKEQIDRDHFAVAFNGDLLVVNEHGNFDAYPKGFCDHSVRVIETLLKTRVAKIRAAREQKSSD